MNFKPSSQTLIQTVSQMQQITTKLLTAKKSLQNDIDCLTSTLTTLQNTKKQKLEKLLSILQNIHEFTKERQNIYCQTKNKVMTTLLEGPQNWHQEGIQVPHHNFTYLMNNPQVFNTLGDRIKQFEEELEKARTKKEEQTRTIKIRISLAEIQLRQLLNRNKKI